MIEFFKEPNIDWMGKAKYFYGLSAILLIAGLISWLHEGGLRYGIDYRGGTNVDVRFAQPPNIDQIRNALQTQGLVQCRDAFERPAQGAPPPGRSLKSGAQLRQPQARR